MRGSGSPRRRYDREIVRLAVPATLALAAEPLYILADTAIVGRLGTPQLGGLAVAAGLLLGVHSLFLFLAYGTTATVGRLLGAGDDAGAAGAGVQGLWLGVGLGTALAVVGLILAGPVVTLMGGSGPVRPYALTYLRISLVGVPALLVTMAATGYLRGLQELRTTVILAMSSAVANLGLEIVFVLGLGLGVAGSAWSTVAVQMVVAAVCARIILRSARRLGVPFRPQGTALRRLARLSRDLVIRSAALRMSMIVATAVAARISVVSLGAHQIAFELWSFLALVLDGLAIAAQASIGRRLGGGDTEGARAIGRRMIELGVVLGVVLGVAILLLRPWLPGLFTEDAEVRSLTAFLLVWVALFQAVNAAVFVLDGILIGAGDMRFLAWAMVLAAAVFLPAALAVLLLDLGIGWLWAALSLLMVTRLAFMAWRFSGDAWAVPGAVAPSARRRPATS